MFEALLRNLERELTEGNSAKEPPALLFRGQHDAEWDLTTTLERSGCKDMTFDAYYRLTGNVLPAIEAFTREKWDVPDYSLAMEAEFREDAQLFSLRKFPAPKFYQYMVYLRHHGFPSPLLDWTSSVYVAAFFAFRHAGTEDGMGSIYVYCERPEGFKGEWVGLRRFGRSANMSARTRDTFVSCPITRCVRR